MRAIDRFDLYMRYKHLNDNSVTKELNLSNGVIGKSRGEGRDLSKRVLEVIEKYYLDLNIDWLKTGEGEMLKPAKKVPSLDLTEDAMKIFLNMSETINCQQKTIFELAEMVKNLMAGAAKQ